MAKVINVVETTIHTASLFAIINKIKGAKIATIITETEPTLLKKGNPFANNRVTKRTKVNVIFNFNYRRALEKALLKRGITLSNKPVGKRAWGVKVPYGPFVMHNACMYLEVKHNHRPSSIEYFVDGVPVATEKIQPFIAAKAPQDVPMCDVKINNIKELRVNKVRYIVK